MPTNKAYYTTCMYTFFNISIAIFAKIRAVGQIC